MGDNIITAIIAGIASGLAATGSHQVGHQLTKPDVQVTAIDYDTIESLLEDDDEDEYDDDEVDEDDEEPNDVDEAFLASIPMFILFFSLSKYFLGGAAVFESRKG